jgi:hypothetical protein
MNNSGYGTHLLPYFCNMSFIKNIGVFYVNANIHVALAASCMVLITGTVFDIAVFEASLFVGFSTVLAYNFIRFLKYKAAALRQDMRHWFERNRMKVCLLTFVCFFGVLFLSFFMKPIALLLLTPFVSIVVLYMTPVFPHGIVKKSLRNLPFVKIFSIGLTWSGACVLFPIFQSGRALDCSVWLYFVYQFLCVLLWTLPFDIRDMAQDKKGMKTIPQVLGIAMTKIMGISILLLLLFVSFLLFENALFLLFCIGHLFLSVALLFSKGKQTPFYASFWVESIPIGQYILFACMDL